MGDALKENICPHTSYYRLYNQSILSNLEVLCRSMGHGPYCRQSSMIAILLGIFLLQGKIFLFWFSDFHSTIIGMLRDFQYIPGTSMIAHSCFRRIHKMQSLVPLFNRIKNPNQIFHWYF